MFRDLVALVFKWPKWGSWNLRSIRWGIVPLLLTLATAVNVFAAQSRSPVKTREGIEILFLGTAGGPPLHKARSEPASLLIVDGRKYLIDCGIGTMRRLLEAGIPSQTIRAIFLTHLHPDHAMGLVDVLANDYLVRNGMGPSHSTLRFNIYGPPRVTELVEDAFRFMSIPYSIGAAENPPHDTHLFDPFVAHAIAHNGLFYQDDMIRVVAAENTHYALMPAKFRAQMKSYSYRFETPDGVVVFTGDTGPSNAVVQLAKGADVLVSEVEDLAKIDKDMKMRAEQNHWPQARLKASNAHMRSEHLDFQEVGELASRAQVKSVVLYHFVPIPKDPATYVARVRKYYPGPVFASADLAEYCLGGRYGRTLHRCH